MVDQADLATINVLNGELRQIALAVAIIDADGRITAMTWASKIDELPGQQVTIDVAAMAWPLPMKDAIKNYLRDREQQIRDQLAGLGITGVDAAEPIAPRAAPPPTSAPKRGART